MIRLHLQVIVIATFVLPSLILAQETKKDPTDILFEQILAETISEQQAEDKKATAPSTRQVGGPTATQGEQFTRPIVTTKNWNQNQTPTFSTPSHTGNNITAQQTSASTRTPAKNTVRSVSGSVSMDLIAPSDINLNQTCTVRIQLKNVGADTLDNVQSTLDFPSM